MAHVNCDPYAGGHLFALANRVTCLLDGEEAVMTAVRALEEGGVATEDIDVFTGEEGAKVLDLFGRNHGRAVRLLRSHRRHDGRHGRDQPSHRRRPSQGLEPAVRQASQATR